MPDDCEKKLWELNDCYSEEEQWESMAHSCIDDFWGDLGECAAECLTVDVRGCAICSTRLLLESADCADEVKSYGNRVEICDALEKEWVKCVRCHPSEIRL